MSERVLYLTESTFDFSHVDPTSKLITKVQEHLPPGVYHTSLGDLSNVEIIHIAPQFDQINFEPRGFDHNSDVYKESVILFKHLTRHKISEHNILTDSPEQFTDHPEISSRPDQPTLWVFGCSHSHGVGLKSGELNYGQLLSQSLGMPLKLITKPGSSLHWSYRHLFNSLIQPQDLVIWQLTTPGRISSFNGKRVAEIVLSCSKDRKLIDSITAEQLYFNQLSLLNTGVKFLRMVKCKFLLISINVPELVFDYGLEYIKYPEYYPEYGTNLDYGTDNQHAGPLSHKAIAQQILNHIQLAND